MDFKVSSLILPPAFAMITASASNGQDNQFFFSLMSRNDITVSRNIPPGCKPKKAVGFCRGSKQHTVRWLQSSIENAANLSTYHSRSPISDHFAKAGPIGSCGVGFGILPINVASEGMMAARKVALGVAVLITSKPGGYLLAFRCHVDGFE